MLHECCGVHAKTHEYICSTPMRQRYTVLWYSTAVWKTSAIVNLNEKVQCFSVSQSVLLHCMSPQKDFLTMNALADKQGMPHSDMHSITLPHCNHITVWHSLFVYFVSQCIYWATPTSARFLLTCGDRGKPSWNGWSVQDGRDAGRMAMATVQCPTIRFFILECAVQAALRSMGEYDNSQWDQHMMVSQLRCVVCACVYEQGSM